MQREELSDSRNRQAAPRNEGQNEGQIWQREVTQALPTIFFAMRCHSAKVYLHSVEGAGWPVTWWDLLLLALRGASVQGWAWLGAPGCACDVIIFQ
jgi:hypothetical protein